jgi:hypothetical protein
LMIARIRFLCNEIDKVEPLKPKGQKMFEHGSTNLGWRLSEDAVVWSIAGRGMLQFSRKGLHRWSGRNRPAASSFPVVVDETAGKNSCVDKESACRLAPSLIDVAFFTEAWWWWSSSSWRLSLGEHWVGHRPGQCPNWLSDRCFDHSFGRPLDHSFDQLPDRPFPQP